MTRLSVNVNKVATLRNARGGDQPSVLDAVRTCIEAGSPGITVHPRADERHIRRGDVTEIGELLAPLRDRVEYNIEGDPRADLVELVERVAPHQFTLVPVRPGEVTSEAGWPADTPVAELRAIIGRMHGVGVRVSVFVEAQPDAIRWAADLGADRVELYTEPFAVAQLAGGERFEAELRRYAEAASLAQEFGLGINAGHDLNLRNLGAFLAAVPGVDEVSIGHALIARALFVGLAEVVGEYLAITTARE